MKKKEIDIEPFLWGLFAGGGMVAAMLVPVHVLIFGIAGPLGWLDPAVTGGEGIVSLLRNPIVKVYLFVLISLPLFHWAHRFRFTVHDLGFKAGKEAVAFVCYSTAALGTVAAALALIAVP